jgi:hypothetical protein
VSIDIRVWVHGVIDGVGGLHEFEECEIATPNIPRDEAVAIWVLKCLGNTKCEGSQKILNEILKHRREVSNE